MLEPELIDLKNNPLLARSGHKVVSDEKYLYIVGGYVERNIIIMNHEVKGEIWCYHLINKTWKKCIFDNDIFSLGASHSAVKVGDCIFITGGTGIPFGKNILNSLIVVNVKKMTQKMFQFIPKNNNIANLPIATYGHTMTYVNINMTPYIFIIGGTTGETYHQEVYQINLITLESELVGDKYTKNVPSSRYKHEAFLYNDIIYVLGGAKGTDVCYDLNQIHMFDIHSKTWTEVKANVPIDVSLRCPSVSQNNQYLYVCGGYPTNEYISKMIYQLDLNNLSWSVIGTWRKPSYFHDSTFVPHLGSLFLFGGVNRIVPSHRRNNDLFIFRPPTGRLSQSLTDLALETIFTSKIMKKMLENNKSTSSDIINYLLNIGLPGYIINRFVNSETRDIAA